MQETQDHERMMLFFKKLIDVKNYVKKEADKSKNPILNTIYEKLDEIIKEEKK